MDNIFYSQQGEDCYIFNNYINTQREDGTFVELGAMDGLWYSNTKFFEDTLKFNGVLIEPTEQYNDLLKNRPNCKCYKNAINNKEEEVEFLGDSATAGLVKTMSTSFKESHHSENNNVYKVQGTPIRNLIKDLKYIDLFSIDVEGGELVVLETIDWKIPIYVIVIELDNHNKDKDEKCRTILREKGFTFDIVMGGNEFWINKNYFRKNILFDRSIKKNVNTIFDYGKFQFLEPHLVESVNDIILYRNKFPLENIYNNELICEDYFTDFVSNNEGLLITRKEINLNTFDFNKENPLVCLTGYNKILQDFFTEIIKKIKGSATVIIIESDVVELKNEWLENDKIKHCYTWNKPFEHNKLSGIPIGLNYYRQGNVMKNWLENKSNNDSDKKLLCVNYSPHTNSVRGQLVEKAKNEWKSFCSILEFIEPTNVYWKESKIEGKIKIDVSNPKCYDVMKEYKFILSPPGAGEDTHRTWEALYVGCIPIVRSSNLNELYTDLPVLIVEDWNIITEDYLEDQYKIIQKNKQDGCYNMDKLYLHYWIKYIQKPVIHFMTYANDVFETAKKRLVKEAKDFNEFISISDLGPENLPSWVQKKYTDILNVRRGGGYWLWRPFILHEKLKQINDGEFIVFLDAGCKLNAQGKKRFFEYIDLLQMSKYGILSFQMSGNKGPGTLAKEKQWTIKEIFQYFGVTKNSIIKETGQFLGGVFIIKKNKHSMNYVKEIIKCMMRHPLLTTDALNANQEEYFIDNRHEQSITSVFRKVTGTVIIDGDESWIQPFGQGESLKYPFWAARSKE